MLVMHTGIGEVNDARLLLPIEAHVGMHTREPHGQHRRADEHDQTQARQEVAAHGRKSIRQQVRFHGLWIWVIALPRFARHFQDLLAASSSHGGRHQTNQQVRNG